ncbi:TPA_asm: protein 3 [Zea virus 1]|uniref:Protein 3 n=1 Tax=Zea virus 1 TaxID=2977999 RepID=A0A9N7AB63_9RHAB|nr:TPA_asm: protein 3 [Zea virus 1]
MSSLKRTTSLPLEINVTKSGTLTNFVTDPLAPTMISKQPFLFGMSWVRKVRDIGSSYDLGKVGIMKGLYGLAKGICELRDPEIHVIWGSYCPAEICQNEMTVSLNFTQSLDAENSLLYQNIAPMHVPAHHIFYPRQTISVGPSAVIPWSVGVHIGDLDISPNFHIGKIQIFLKGHLSGGNNHTTGKDSELILLAPPDDIMMTGTRVSRPRVFGSDWKTGGFKLGGIKPSDIARFQLMKNEGIDIEGIVMAGKMASVLKALKFVNKQNMDNPEVRTAARKTIYKSIV